MADTTIQKQGEVFISQSEYDALRLAGNLQSNTKYHITKTPKTGVDSLEQMNLLNGDKTITYDTTNGMTVNGTARFTYTDGNHDATMDISIPIVGSDTITIDKAADSQKIEVKVNTDKFVNRYIDNFDTGSYYEENVYGFIYDNGNFHPTYFAIGSPAPNNIARYTEDGKLMIIDSSTGMTEVSEAASMLYLESNFIKRQYDEYAVFTTDDVGGVEMIPYSTSSTPNTMVRRDEKGHVRVADPEGQSDAVHKAYVDNKFRYTHSIDIEFSPMEGIVICKGIITYVSNSPTPLTSYEQLPLDVELPAQGVFANDPSWSPLYKATKRQTSSGSTYLEITTLQFSSASYITVGGKGTQVGAPLTKFVDTVF